MKKMLGRRWHGPIYQRRKQLLGGQQAAKLEMKEMTALEKRRRRRALVRSWRNQPPTEIWSEWLCDECWKAGQKVRGPSGCFRKLYCRGCGQMTEHSGVVPTS